MTGIHDIETVLRTLDSAEPPVDPNSGRARTDLLRILATDPSREPLHPLWSPTGERVRRPRPAARTARRVVLAGATLAAVTTGLIALSVAAGGDQAFASWTPTPAGMTAEERAEAAAGCRSSQQAGAGGEYADQLVAAEPVIAERRGVWTTVVLAGKDGFSAMCITDDSARLFTEDVLGSVGTPTSYTAPEPRELVATDLGSGSMDAGDLSLAAGVAGRDVIDVVYRSRTHGEVAATVSQGHFALWLPGAELEDAASSGVEVTVTYRDGTTGTSRLSL